MSGYIVEEVDLCPANKRRFHGGVGRIGARSKPLWSPAAFSLRVCHKKVTNKHALATSSQEDQIGHAANTFKLFHGRPGTRWLDIRVNTFGHKCLRSSEIH